MYDTTYLPTVVFLGGRDKGGRGETKPAIFIIMVVINQSINQSIIVIILTFDFWFKYTCRATCISILYDAAKEFLHETTVRTLCKQTRGPRDVVQCQLGFPDIGIGNVGERERERDDPIGSRAATYCCWYV